jgi:ABC-2 type transport system permease protein
MPDAQRSFWPAAARVARKEFRAFFASPAAYLFLGAFVAAVLFSFFWVETFFARNIADVRPLFKWLPLLLVFLVAALTMRAWSEERRAGTLESLLTAPVPPLALVLGKFAAIEALVALALALTLPLPVTVSLLGPLDWGPVAGGYVATLLLAAAYAAIGLAMSARTDNPVVALITTVAVGLALVFVGSPALTNLFGQPVGRWLELVGTGSRFESITRGVLDLRDLVYFATLAAVFLTLNLYTLERLRWAGNPPSPRHRARTALAALLAANFIAVDLWIVAVPWLRLDLTQGRVFTLSEATRTELHDLREPLLIRGYFSAKTHPYLAPLVPRLEDLLREYAVAAGPRARVEFIDPTHDRAQEEEAASRYGIQPVPFQTADRYQAAVVNSYFDVVVAYGDQFEKLDFRDLIEVKGRSEEALTVVLKNPEYGITRAIRKVVDAYQAGGNAFASLTRPVKLAAYFSPDPRLPEPMRRLHADLTAILDQEAPRSHGKLSFSVQDPDADGGKVAHELRDKYGLAPQIASLADPQPFWFTMLLDDGTELVQVPLPDRLDRAGLERTLQSALRRMAPGFLKTVAVLQPSPQGAMPGMPPAGPTFSRLDQALAENVRVRDVDLKDGRVPDDADLLLVLAPQQLDDKQRFAIDQFLMRGGPVVLATSPYDVSMGTGIVAAKQKSGLEDWLAHFGVRIEDTMVVDPHNAALPIPVQRVVGGLSLREIRMLPYPHFPDLRGDSLDPDSPITRSLQQLTLNWASPIDVDPARAKGLKVVDLLRSSAASQTSTDTGLVPDMRGKPPLGFRLEGGPKPRVLALALEGRFESAYRGRPSPLAAAPAASAASASVAAAPAASAASAPAPTPTSVIDHSPADARLVVVASNSFGSDMAIELASQGLNTLYLKPVEFIENTIDWALEDPALLALRGRTQLARTLVNLSEDAQRVWEIGNYLLALAGLAAIWGWRRAVARADQARHQRLLAQL